MALQDSMENSGLTYDEVKELKDYYTYPEGLDLHPDSEQHHKLLTIILDRVKESYDVISKRFPEWRSIDQKMSVYIDLTEEDQRTKDEDASKPVAIVVPMAYATRETLLTYMVSAFLNDHIFKYEASMDPKDTIGVILLENIINHHVIKSKVGLDLHTMWSDAFTYGFGAVSPTWRTEKGFRTKQESRIEKILGIPFRKRLEGVKEEIVKFDGNALLSLDPYNCFPDVNVPVAKMKDQNYFGWINRTSYNQLLTDEQLSEGTMFNVRFLKGQQIKGSAYYSNNEIETGRYSKTGIEIETATSLNKGTDVITLYANIIPKDHGLGAGEYPENWVFRVASDRIIISAHPVNLDHNDIPVCTCSPDFDGHTTIPVSIIEREFPLQHAVDWLWKSHVATIRKTVNNMFLVDPSLVNMNDVVDTKFGMIARLRPAAWGRGVDKVMAQLPVQDVTQANIADIGFLMQVDSMTFTSDQAKSMTNRSKERVSAQEARDTRMSFLSKMEKMARIIAMQAHYDIADQFASNTIQLLQGEQYVKLTGDYDEVLAAEFGKTFDRVKVSPEALDVRYDVVAHDGTVMGGEYADNWERLLKIATASPETFQSLDFVRVWKHIARLLGAKNPQDFLKRGVSPQVGSEQEIAQGTQQGNLVTPAQLEGSQNVGEV